VTQVTLQGSLSRRHVLLAVKRTRNLHAVEAVSIAHKNCNFQDWLAFDSQSEQVAKRIYRCSKRFEQLLQVGWNKTTIRTFRLVKDPESFSRFTLLKQATNKQDLYWRTQASHYTKNLWPSPPFPNYYSHTFWYAGISPLVISSMNFMSGLYSITWKCSTACIDLRDFQFLNQITYIALITNQNLTWG